MEQDYSEERMYDKRDVYDILALEEEEDEAEEGHGEKWEPADVLEPEGDRAVVDSLQICTRYLVTLEAEYPGGLLLTSAPIEFSTRCQEVAAVARRWPMHSWPQYAL